MARPRGKHSHLYSKARWRKLRAAQLESHPLCEICKADGKATPANVVDHVIPHRGDMVRFWAGPFQSLCKTCHDRHKKMQEEGGMMMGCSADGTPTAADHWWNKETT
ncbi:MAG: HNH endonuclease [FCB group bacterium]|nr:HNH endonuclease [FCB group bacterium]